MNEDRRRRPAPKDRPAPDHVWVEVPFAPGGWASYPRETALDDARRVWGESEVTGVVVDPDA